MRFLSALPLVLASAASAQIVVGRAGEEVQRPIKIVGVVCQLNLGDGRSALSELIWVPNDRATLELIGDEFEAYGKSISRFTNNSACHEYPSYNWFPKPAGTMVDKLFTRAGTEHIRPNIRAINDRLRPVPRIDRPPSRRQGCQR